MKDKQDTLDKLRASIAAIEASGSSLHPQAKPNTENLTSTRYQPTQSDISTLVKEKLALTGYSRKSSQQDTLLNEVYTDVTSAKSKTIKSKENPTPEDALNKIVRLVNHREHSVTSLRKRLQQAGFNHDIIDSALKRAQELGLVDDIRYGNILTRSRISQKKGCQGIERELIQEGINPEDIEAYLEYRDEIAPKYEISQAVAFLEKHPPKAKNQRESAYRKLRQKGYDNSTTHEAIKIWMSQQS